MHSTLLNHSSWACLAAMMLAGCSSDNEDGTARLPDTPTSPIPQSGSITTSKPLPAVAQPVKFTAVDTSRLMTLPYDYEVEKAFPNLDFGNQRPIQLTAVPGDSKRVVVMCQEGRVHRFSNQFDVSKTDVFLDITDRVSRSGNEEGLLGFAFHPSFESNGELYVCYSAAGPKILVSRFHIAADRDESVDPGSEEILLAVDQPFRTQNGGSIEFGPDGFLYIGLGDGGSSNDPQYHGQNLGTLHGSILRIDVDHAGDDTAYAIPKDNPFVDDEMARDEIWAYGFRNVWRLAFDRQTGQLWAGDVGQNRFEEINLIKRGGNYGWSEMEGTTFFEFETEWEFPPKSMDDLAAERDRYEAPVAHYYHSEGRAVVGGKVYHGSKLPDLVGAYLYADFATGNVWALRHNGNAVTSDIKLCNSGLPIAGFGEDGTGEIYLCSFDGHIYRLKAIPERATADRRFPSKLSETGLFESTPDLKPIAGVIPYSVNVPLWSDHAIKERYLALPSGGSIGFSESETWELPAGAVVMKTFSMDLTRGVPTTRQRLETRLLVHTQSGWEGYTYIWNDDQDDAWLIDASLTLPLDIETPDGPVHQTWYVPSRSDCNACHTDSAKFVLSVNTRQLNRIHDYPDGPANQLVRLNELGVFKQALPKAPEALQAYPEWSSSNADNDRLARAYLDVNCAFCHAPGGPGNSPIDLRFHTPENRMGVIGRPARGTRFAGLPASALVSAGRPQDSELIRRMELRGPGQMPVLATFIPDKKALAIVEDWINEIKPGHR